MIELKNITLVFNPGKPGEVSALRDLSLKLKKGSFNMVIGANGSGKSSLLNAMAGNIRPSAGSILMLGKDITQWPVFERSRFIARIFQNPSAGTAPTLSLIENFRLASLRTRSKGPFAGISKDFRKVVASHLSILDMGLENRLDQAMGSFSGGQRQALSLLMATFDHVDLLLLDEPTAALDPRSADLVLHLAHKIIREKQLTALMVTHDLRHCFSGIDRLIHIDQGRLRRDVDPEELSGYTLANLREWF
jgi:putative ABC transport system ATP-binding protein